MSNIARFAAYAAAFEKSFESDDWTGVEPFFAEDAVKLDGAERIDGAEAIRAGELAEFEVHAPGGEAYSISNLVVTDNVVTWDRLFKGPAHTCVGTGDEAVVEI